MHGSGLVSSVRKLLGCWKAQGNSIRDVNSMHYIIAILFIFIVQTGYTQFDHCTLKKDKDGIKVYTCKSEHDRFKTLKASFIIKQTTPEELESFLRNVSNYPSWQYNMASADILKSNTVDGTMIIRSEIDAPWPLENRELIAQFSVQRFQDAEQLQFTVKTIAYDYPSAKGLVRVPFSHAQWDIKKVNDSVEVVYTMRIDPGGVVPAWLVNMAMAEGPYTSFVNLKKQLEKK